MTKQEGGLEEWEPYSFPSLVPLLRADPHHWGAGLIHLIDEEKDQTYCGKSPGGCPGRKFYGGRDKITCKSCLRSIEAKAQAQVRQEQYRQEAEERERARAESNRLWWQRYNAYPAFRHLAGEACPRSPSCRRTLRRLRRASRNAGPSPSISTGMLAGIARVDRAGKAV